MKGNRPGRRRRGRVGVAGVMCWVAGEWRRERCLGERKGIGNEVIFSEEMIFNA
jgi:hypothetical protein